MFMDAISHVARITRVLRQPKGNMLLLGVGGSGRQSLSRLSTFMAECKIFSIEITKGYGAGAASSVTSNLIVTVPVPRRPGGVARILEGDLALRGHQGPAGRLPLLGHADRLRGHARGHQQRLEYC